MQVPNDEKYNHRLKCFDTYQDLIKVLKVSQQIREYIYKTLGTTIIYSLMSPPSLDR